MLNLRPTPFVLPFSAREFEQLSVRFAFSSTVVPHTLHFSRLCFTVRTKLNVRRLAIHTSAGVSG
jgi:hypothetical protein